MWLFSVPCFSGTRGFRQPSTGSGLGCRRISRLVDKSLYPGGVVSKEVVDIRSLQKPFKAQYRADPQSSRITLTAKGGETNTPLSCSVDIGRAIYQAEAHTGVGGSGTAACSGDLLLGALAACAQLTCQLVAIAMGIETRHIAVTVDGDMDLSGTLGISKDVSVGFSEMRVKFEIDAPNATPEQLQGLREKTEQYCVVLQTLLHPPTIKSEWATAG
ncbi:MAG: OsmC family protein [Acidobacteria bacterium]|nr:OsmC family protein [Acidobacteriota bacterium]